MSTVTQKCFSKSNFGIKDVIDIEKRSRIKMTGWNCKVKWTAQQVSSQ
jgi:hypothetical protein